MIPRPGRFFVVALAGATLQLGVVWALVHGAGVPPTFATLVAVVSAVVHNFEWHRRWTWRDRPVGGIAGAAAFVRFVSANGLVSTVGNITVSIALVDLGRMDALVANAIAIASCGIVNYALADRVVFRAGTGAPGCAVDRSRR